MKKFLFLCIFLLVFSQIHANPAMLAHLLSSTEADPDSFIDHQVNVIHGDYCEVVTDLVIKGSDSLVMQRYYSNSNYITGEGKGGWRIFPQCWLTIGKGCDSTYALTGERSGSLLTYHEKDDVAGLKVDVSSGISNTARGEISGKSNLQNNRLKSQEQGYLLTLGDGTRRYFEKVNTLPISHPGIELYESFSKKIRNPEYYHLVLEILPSGNKLRYEYNELGQLMAITMVNFSEKKILSWIHFKHEKHRLSISTSDEKTITYHVDGSFIRNIEYSDKPSCSYQYNEQGKLIQKAVSDKILELDYDAQGRVVCLKEMLDSSEELSPSKTFSYRKGVTEVCNALGQKTAYLYNKRNQLEAIERYDLNGVKYRTDRKFWEGINLFASTIEDGKSNTLSYRSYTYDEQGNVIEERLYGNLTGKSNTYLQMDARGQLMVNEDTECHIKKVEYSKDGFNLVAKLGDCKGNEILFEYLPGTNLLSKKLVNDNKIKTNQRRSFYFYNEDATLIKTIEDDGSHADLTRHDDITERQITTIFPKEQLPGVGLPLEVKHEVGNKKEKWTPTLLKRFINTFDSQGHLLQEDTYGSDNSYAYSKMWEYDLHGNLIRETDPEGKETLCSYDSLGHCLLKQMPHQNISIAYVYDRQGRMISTTEDYGSATYTLTMSYDPLGRLVSSTDRLGRCTDYAYDACGFLAKVTHPIMKDEQGNFIRPTETYENDLFGRPLVTMNARGDRLVKSYNLRGSPITIDYPDGTYEIFKYDTEGSLHRHLTRDKIISIFEYDFLGRETNHERSSLGIDTSRKWIDNIFHKYSAYRLTSVRNKGAYTCYEYDNAGRPIKTYRPSNLSDPKDDPNSRKEEYAYDALGRISQKKIYFEQGQNDFSIEHFTYDLAHRIIAHTIQDAQSNLLQATRSLYDERGFLVEEQALLDGTYITRVKTEYNALGEPISIIDAEGEQTLFVYDIITDETGQNVSKKTIIDSTGASTEIFFDAFDRVVSLTKTSRQGEPLSQQICAYDPVGNKVSEQNRNFLPSGAQETQTTRWVVGPMQQLKELHEGVGTDQERITHYTYGEDGKLASKLLPGMQTPILYTYNAQGRLYKISQKEGPEHLHLTNTYTYDGRGNVITAHSLHGKVVSREYNAFNEITAETIRENQFVYSILYDYDRKGRVTSIKLPDKSAIHYTYDALHGKNVSRKSSNEELLYTHAYTQFDTWGRLKQEEKPFQLGLQKREYNSRSQPTLRENNFYQENLGYDLLGNLLYIHRSGGFSNLSYTYNPLSQLIAEQGEVDIAYSYDSLGNRLTKNEKIYTYGTCNQLLSTPEDLYQYNPQGLITQRQRNQQAWAFENNALGQLILLHKDDKTELEFSYDPFGRRLSKKHFDVSTKYRKKISISHYLYIGNREVGTLDDNKKILELQVPGISDESIAFELQGKTLIPLYDVRGNVLALVDPTEKRIVESYAYSAFGEEKIFDASHQQIETSTNPWRYAGQRKDAETNLLLIGLRYYDPHIGRWLSPDPALFIDGPNLYAYTQNNPLHYLDRHGLSSEDRYDEGWNDYLFGEVENHCFCERHRTCKRGGDLDKNYTYGPEATCIKFLDHFECSEQNKSRRYDLSSESEFQTLSRGMIIFINGINTTFEEAQDNSRHLGRLAGGYKIHGIYNATHGWLTDFYEYFLNRNLCATPPVRHLHLQWNQFFAQANSDTPLLVVCHSQGAVLLRNALMCYPKELRDRIIVVAVAPGVYIEDNLCRQVTHYVAEWDRDIVPWLNPTGRFHNRENVVVLKSDKDAPWFDHGFQSPTYNRSISDDLQKYVKRYGF